MFSSLVRILTGLALLPAALSAQRDSASVVCTDELVSRIDIQPAPPPFSGAAKKWRAAAHTVGLHHATTDEWVVAAFLSLHVGLPCTEFRRSESERVLRAQPFLSDARVRIVRDTGGTVAVVVTTTDEVPVLVTGRFRGVVPQYLSIGNENIAGEALLVQLRAERGGAYRAGIGGRLEQNAFMGHPYRLIIDGDRLRIGHRLSAEVEHPFFTDLQRISWHGGFVTRDDYLRFSRPARDPLALQAFDRSWDVSSLWRLFGVHSVALIGAAITGRDFDPAAQGLLVDSLGLMPDTGKTLTNRYTRFKATRLGVTGGLRRVTFREVRGFDALVGSQDVASGALFGVFAAKGLSQLGESDDFLSSALYLGASSSNALLAMLAQVEGRYDPVTQSWNSVIGSSRTAFYWGRAPGVVLVLSDEFSGGGTMSRLPLQLSFDTRDGGLMGYHNSALAGGRRNITRAEMRWSAESLLRGADMGFATFTEVGTLWAGDAPYGVNATRANAGVSLLAAYPAHAKRMYRVDIAIPFTRGGEGAGRVEVRFSSADRTQGFFTEPADVARARTGIEPSRLFAWPTR
ncbi:MAG: hypothetical protein JWM95_5573 [Gemmatimonadetes bacterium]|nr:hypothetical protein [Gemmatimonadota bacterium]